MPSSHGWEFGLPHLLWGEHKVQWEHAHGSAGVGMDLRVGWKPKQQRAEVRSTLKAPVGAPVLQQFLLLKPSCHGLTQTQRHKQQGPELAQTTEKGVSRTLSTILCSFSLEASVPRVQTNRAGLGAGQPTELGWLSVPRTSGLSTFSLSTKQNEAVYPSLPLKCKEGICVCTLYCGYLCTFVVCARPIVYLCVPHCNMYARGSAHICKYLVCECMFLCKQPYFHVLVKSIWKST